MHASRVLIITLTLLSGGVVADAQTGPVYLLAQGTYANVSRGVVYLANSSTMMIQAVDLVTGAPVWSSSSAAVPIGGNDTYLAAQAGQSATGALTVVFLDPRDGIAVSQADIPLPAGVISPTVPSVEAGYFVAKAEADGSDFDVSWYYTVGGSGAAPKLQYAGGARVDPGTGTIKSADGGSVSDYPAWYLRYGQSPEGPWQVGGVTASVAFSYSSGSAFVMKRTVTATGEALPDVLLTYDGWIWASADARELLIEEEAGGFDYHIRVVSMETGETLGSFLTYPIIDAPAQFVVLNGTLIVLEQDWAYLSGNSWITVPPSVVAFTLPTGGRRWSVPWGAAPVPPHRRSVRH